jgi:hypothetical protein
MTKTKKKKPEIDDPRLNLSGRVLLATALIITAFVLLIPAVWKKIETFNIPEDYRIPYFLSKDYGLYERRLERIEPGQIPILGDSVIWGEYVRRDGTLSHFLNQEIAESNRFVNAGVNGLFPLALEGLLRHYGKPIRNRKVILHCNPLWMTTPESDLSNPKERKFNHARLIPQFTMKIPCYRAIFNDRASIVITRQSSFFSWVGHIQNTYFDQKNLYAWTLADNGKYPPGYPNAQKNPLAQITFKVPEEPDDDPDRGPGSPRHKPWSTTGNGTQNFEWVPLSNSIQWGAFRRASEYLQKNGCDILVVVGPFNRHIMASENRALFDSEMDGIQAWLKKQNIPFIAPATLDSRLYGDSSHPLTDGYKELASEIARNPICREWLRNTTHF